MYIHIYIYMRTAKCVTDAPLCIIASIRSATFGEGGG